MQKKDLTGYYYKYIIDELREVADPFAHALVGPAGPGIVLSDRAKRSRYKTPKLEDLVIMEVHVRDLLSGAPKGFSELREWVESCASYVEALGVNAVELLPITEFESGGAEEYHWGYMPVNFFSPSSAYGSDPERGSQVEEFRALVKAFKKRGIAVILDLVYNHVGAPNHCYGIEREYYFEGDGEGNLTNWSGCGNDFRASAPMARRMILESLRHWIKSYGIDGFRFDLAELIGQEVLEEIESTLRIVKPDVILIAEPWSFRGHIGHALRESSYAVWNDGYREFIADFVKGHSNLEAFRYFIAGSSGHLTRRPSESINYAASHDDYAWIDKITEHGHHDGRDPTIHDLRRTHLMVAMLMMSLGTPMITAGMEMLHSKAGVSNTYNRGDLNALDYGRQKHFSATYEYFRAWIALRRSKLGKLMRIGGEIGEGYLAFFEGSGGAYGVLYNADRSNGAERLLFIVNTSRHDQSVNLGDFDGEGVKQVADTWRLREQGLEDLTLEVVDSVLHLSGLSCGLWRC